MWQSPAIFLQHSISDFVIVEVGTQARAGVPIHTKTSTKDRMARHFTILIMLQLSLFDGKPAMVILSLRNVESTFNGGQ